MNVKKKLTSVLSLTLALCMLLSTAAMALDSGGEVGTTDAGDSSFVESTSPEETDKTAEADSSASSGDADPVEPTDPADSIDSTEPADSTEPSDTSEGANSAELPAEADENDIPSPDVMSTPSGWTLTSEGKYIYYYLDGSNTKLAGNGYTGSNYQVLYLPEQTITVNSETPNSEPTEKTFAAGFYCFQNGSWADIYTSSDTARYKNIAVIALTDGQYQVTETYSYRMLNIKNGVGSLYSGRHTDSDGIQRRYDNGIGRNGYALGTDSNLYYYVDGNYQTSTSKEKVKGYHTYNSKLYYGAGTKYYAVPFTGRRTENGVKRRYNKGSPYNGYGLGTEKTPNLYYYVNGYYNKNAATSKEKLTGFHKYGDKWYYGTTTSLKKYNAPLANNVYRLVNNKLYKFTKGVASLYTGVYKNYYYSKGVKQTKSGWVTVGGNTYYFKSGKAVTGWQYLSRNSKTYKYYFKSDGALVKDLFTYFGNSYLSKKMIVQVNRTTHTADILLYDSAKKSYCIAASSFVCSTCEKSSDFKTGTYKLYSNRRRRWFTFTHPETKKTTYYQYATFIVGTDAWIHSPQYKKKNIRTLNASNYNKLGTNQTFYCVRFQTLYSKRIYDAVGKQGSKKVQVKLYKSSNKGPYGKITLAGSTGKLPKSQNYDPTDPAI